MKKNVKITSTIAMIIILVLSFATPQVSAATPDEQYATSIDLTQSNTGTLRKLLYAFDEKYSVKSDGEYKSNFFTNDVVGTTSKSTLLKANGYYSAFSIVEGSCSNGQIYDNEYCVAYYVMSRHYYTDSNKTTLKYTENILVRVKLTKDGKLEKILQVNNINNMKDTETTKKDRSLIGHGNDLTYLNGYTLDGTKIIKKSGNFLLVSSTDNKKGISFIKFNKDATKSTVVNYSIDINKLDNISDADIIYGIAINPSYVSGSTAKKTKYQFIANTSTKADSNNKRTNKMIGFNLVLSSNVAQFTKCDDTSLATNRKYYGSLKTSSAVIATYGSDTYNPQGIVASANYYYAVQNIKGSINRIIKFSWNSDKFVSKSEVYVSAYDKGNVTAEKTKGYLKDIELETMFFIVDDGSYKMISPSVGSVNYRILLYTAAGNKISL